MIRTKATTLMALLGVVAVSATVSASALATPAYYIEGKAITTNESVTGTSGTSTLTSTVLGVPFEIVSTRSKVSGSISPGGTSKYTVTFEENTVKSPAGCKLSEAVQHSFSTTALSGQLSEEGTGFLTTFAETPVFEITLSRCTNNWWNGSHLVSGSVGATEPGTESIEQPLSFSKTTHDDLTWLGGNLFTITTTANLKLSGVNKGKKFGIDS